MALGKRNDFNNTDFGLRLGFVVLSSVKHETSVIRQISYSIIQSVLLEGRKGFGLVNSLQIVE